MSNAALLTTLAADPFGGRLSVILLTNTIFCREAFAVSVVGSMSERLKCFERLSISCLERSEFTLASVENWLVVMLS